MGLVRFSGTPDENIKKLKDTISHKDHELAHLKAEEAQWILIAEDEKRQINELKQQVHNLKRLRYGWLLIGFIGGLSGYYTVLHYIL